ncbi:YARHG domain-containing protein [Clostridium lacusfryxellense]|uniref:YARHG domain-containing protein n=1 Tax=Clostridium lacusfryxellense TaxID=205328 RepID=UPI001C0BA485|nr:YARHG domain-containing protein [Clostridium lacusfryxellense]MBU3110993.1 YARHG domain-containing protein [Clostridium lacusfryxellense]
MRNISYNKLNWVNILIISLFSLSLVGCSTLENASTNEESICVQITESTIITFPDKNLEQMVRDIIQCPTGAIIKDDVDKISSLQNTIGKHITNLSGIENLTNLTLLNLSNNQITNIEPLIGLTKLTDLALVNNKITNIEPLKELANLNSLELDNNKIKDYSPISGYYKNLERTDVAIADVTPMEEKEEEEINTKDQFVMSTDTISKQDVVVEDDDKAPESPVITPQQEVVVKDTDKVPESRVVTSQQEVIVKDTDKVPETPVIAPEQEVVAKDTNKAPVSPDPTPQQEVVVKDNDQVPETPSIIPDEDVVVKPNDEALEAPVIIPDQEVTSDDDNAPESPAIPPQQEEVPNDVDADFILPSSSTVKLEESDLVNLTKQQLILARNEIYARHGLIFNTEDIQTYFESKSWYHPDATDESEIDSIETFNVQLIEKIEEINDLPN